jgi:hypothetical protein
VVVPCASACPCGLHNCERGHDRSAARPTPPGHRSVDLTGPAPLPSPLRFFSTALNLRTEPGSCVMSISLRTQTGAATSRRDSTS